MNRSGEIKVLAAGHRQHSSDSTILVGVKIQSNKHYKEICAFIESDVNVTSVTLPSGSSLYLQDWEIK